jgi:hypothetical protein
MINPYDVVGVSFWFIAIINLLTALLIFVDKQSLSVHWRLPLSILGVVMFFSGCHYYSMQQIWISQQNIALAYRYLEWVVVLPFQLVVSYLVLRVDGRFCFCLFRKLYSVSFMVLMLGYLIELELLLNYWTLVMAVLWGFVLYTLWFGPAERAKSAVINLSALQAFTRLRLIVTFGWLVYPLMYCFEAMNVLDPSMINLCLNGMDLINKLLFSLIIIYASYKDSGLLHTK